MIVLWLSVRCGVPRVVIPGAAAGKSDNLFEYTAHQRIIGEIIVKSVALID